MDLKNTMPNEVSKAYMLGFCLYKLSRMDSSIRRKGRLLIAEARGKEVVGNGVLVLMDIRFLLGMRKHALKLHCNDSCPS